MRYILKEQRKDKGLEPLKHESVVLIQVNMPENGIVDDEMLVSDIKI